MFFIKIILNVLHLFYNVRTLGVDFILKLLVMMIIYVDRKNTIVDIDTHDKWRHLTTQL